MYAVALNTGLKKKCAERPEMSRLEYEAWRDFIENRCGMYFDEGQIQFLSQCLWNRMRSVGAASYIEYYRCVALNPDREGEWWELLELLVNNETSFFRHVPSYEALTDHVLPDLIREKSRRGIKTVSMWSAGCSTGQEPYSMAMAVKESSGLHGWEISVHGSDISQRAIEKANEGVFKSYESRRLPFFYSNKYTSPVEHNSDVFRQVKDDVRSITRFGYFNLNDPDSYRVTLQDVIFCQNVLIYFRPEKRVEIVRELCQRLNPGGYLFLAPAEVVGLKLPGIQSVRFKNSLAYQRTG